MWREDEDEEDDDTVVSFSSEGLLKNREKSYAERLEAARKFTRENPRIVANIVRNWMEAE